MPLALASVMGSGAIAQSGGAGAFREGFEGQPGSPRPFDPPDWDVAVHSRDLDTWEQLEPMEAHHGGDCSPHPAAHHSSSYAMAVFTCRDHVMTAMNASGYGAIYLTPNRLVDFSRGGAVIRFDISTLRTSDRDWWDVWITPYGDNLQAPLEEWLPDLAGPPRNAVQISLDQSNSLIPRVYEGHDERVLPSRWWTSYSSFLSPSATRRDTVEIRISRDRLKVGMPDHGQWFVDTAVDLAWSQGVVQFAHHSYTPEKDGKGGTANTWHWDEVEIEPALPFTMIDGDRRMISDDTPTSERTVTFAAPAPAGSHLRFSGAGQSIDVSFDGGRTWAAAQRPSQVARNGLLFSNYWTPIPAGTRQVTIRGTAGWVGAWNAKDFAIWSRSTSTATPTTTTAPPATTSTTAPSASTSTSTTTVGDGATQLSVRARGDIGAEIVALLIDGREVDRWTVGQQFSEHTTSVPGPVAIGSVDLRYVNDLYAPPVDRNLEVDWVRVGGSTYQAEGPAVVSSGVWTGGRCSGPGLHETQHLACSGGFDFEGVPE